MLHCRLKEDIQIKRKPKERLKEDIQIKRKPKEGGKAYFLAKH